MFRPFQRPAAVLAFLTLFAAAGTAEAQRQAGSASRGTPRSHPKIVEAFKPAVAKAADSTVSVRIDGKQVALGVVVDAAGYILTKDTELRGEKIVVRFRDGKELPARKVSGNDTWDLAMLKVDAKDLVPVTWVDSKVAEVGNWVATPAPGDVPAAIGVVSVAARTMPPSPKLSLPTDPSKRGYLGVQMEDAEGGGVRLMVISPKSPAEKAGLKVDDVVLGINGRETPDRETMAAVIGLNKPGDTVKIRVRRGDAEEEVEATLEKRPPSLFDRGDFQNSMGTDRSQRRTGFPVALQHDSVLKANECGGPLVDLDGRVIGINIARGGRTDSYAIPSESIRPLLAKLKSGNSASAALTDKIKAAEAAVKEAEAAKTAAYKRLAEAKAALEKLLEELKQTGANRP